MCMGLVDCVKGLLNVYVCVCVCVCVCVFKIIISACVYILYCLQFYDTVSMFTYFHVFIQYRFVQAVRVPFSMVMTKMAMF